MIQPSPGPRYYQANDPVVLARARLGPRHGADGTEEADGVFACTIERLEGFDPGRVSAETIDALSAVLAEIDHRPSRPVQDRPPWNQIALEWRVQVRALYNGTNAAPSSRHYDPAFLRRNYRLLTNLNDVTRRHRLDENRS